MPYYPEDWAATMQPALQALVASELGDGWTVIWADQDGPAPARPLATLKALTLPRYEGRPAVSGVDVDDEQLDQVVSVDAGFTLSIQLFAAVDTRAAMETLRLGLFASLAREALEAAGLVAVQELDARDLSQIFAGRREWRSALDIRMRVEARRVFTDVAWIQTPGITVNPVGG